MVAKKTVWVNENSRPIRIEASDNETYFGDTAVTIYDDFKISLVLTDDCGAVIGNKVFFPQRGDMIIFRPDEVHFGRFPKSGKYRFVSFFIPVDFFEGAFPNSKSIIAPFLDEEADRINLVRLPEEYKNRLVDIAEKLLSVIKESEEWEIVAFSMLVEALHILNRFYNAQKSVPYSPPVPPVVIKAMEKMDVDFPAFTGLTGLAEYVGCSVTYLTQSFKRYTGKSIYSYLTERRLEHARRLLKNGVSVTDACYQSGFSDCSGFISLFKKHFNSTPGKYGKDS